MICSTNAIESLNARYRRAVRARGHFPSEHAALKCLYSVTRSLDPDVRFGNGHAVRSEPLANRETDAARAGPFIHPPFANIAAASGARRDWIFNLHAALAPRGIYAAHIAIAAWIGKRGPKSDPAAIASAY